MEEINLSGKTLLVVDDEVDLRDIVASELEFMGAKVLQAENVASAQQILQNEKVDLIVSDIRMPGGTGIDLLNFIKSKNVCSPPIILITGFADITVEDAFDKGAEALISKPFKLEELIQSAAKLTSPVEERYNSGEDATKVLKFQFSETLQNKINKGDFSIGRGGLSITLDGSAPKLENGEHLNFFFRFMDTEIRGTGICRWWRSLDHSSYQVQLGLEFEHLNEDTLDYFLDYWKHNVPVSFIPSLH